MRPVHHVGVSGDLPVGREDDDRLRDEVYVVPVVELLLRGRAVLTASTRTHAEIKPATASASSHPGVLAEKPSAKASVFESMVSRT